MHQPEALDFDGRARSDGVNKNVSNVLRYYWQSILGFVRMSLEVGMCSF